MRPYGVKPLLLFLAAFLAARGAASAAGTSSAAFLRIGWGARPAAMGDAFTGAADDVDSLYWNPAGLTYVKRLQQAFNHNSWIEGVNVEHASFAVRRDKLSVLGAGVGYVNIGDIDRADKYGNAAGFYSASDMVFMFSYARVLKPGLSGGATFKIIRERIESASAQSFALDAGAVYELNSRIKLGATLKNLGTGITLAKTPGPLPLGLRVGAAYEFSKVLLLTSDISLPFDDSLGLHLGGEYLYPSTIKGVRLALRAGVKTSGMSYLGALSAVSLGFGAEKGSIGLDYALSPYGDFGLAHRLSLKIKFDSLSKGRDSNGEIVVERDGKKISRNAGLVYNETMRWFSGKVGSEKLDRAEQSLLLEKIIEKFEPLGVDVSDARTRLNGLKNGPQ